MATTTTTHQQQTNDNKMGDTQNNNNLLETHDIKMMDDIKMEVPDPDSASADNNIINEPSGSSPAPHQEGALQVGTFHDQDDEQQDEEIGMENSEDNNNLQEEEEPIDEEQDDFEQNGSLDGSEQPPENNPNIWTLPADKNVCTLEEIRRGQVINGKPPTMCPVMGCGKIINEAKAEPSPGTIASGLRTHVLFVHYATQHGRKVVKKRKTLGWSTKKRNQSPRKQLNQLLANRFQNFEQQSTSVPLSASDDFRNDPLDLKQQSTSDLLANLQKNMAAALTPALNSSAPGSLLDKKVKQIAANKSLQVLQMSSHQSLMQTSSSNGTNSNQAQRPKNLNTANSSNTAKQNTNNNNNNNFNSTTSSLFSILAGLTAQQQKNPQQPSLPRNIKTAHGANTINISQCSRNQNQNNGTTTNNSNNNRTVNSSLLSLLNEKISGNVASSLQNQLKKSLAEQRLKVNSSTPRLSTSPALTNNSSYYHPNNNESNGNGASLLRDICSSGVGLSDDNNLYDTSMPLNTFVDMIAMKTGSNIGQSGIAEVKKFIEKFTTSLICSSQTIADHYIAPYGGDAPQQKPEISPSDVILAYKMMNRSQL